jgi:hypothetical protein
MNDNALRTSLLDLIADLSNAGIELILGGGYGLYLKQVQLQAENRPRTAIPGNLWPVPRATEDLDLFLRTEIVASMTAMTQVRAALDRLGYSPVEAAKFMQFEKPFGSGVVKIDLLTGPVAESARSRVKIGAGRVRPIPLPGSTVPKLELHAHSTEEALAIEEDLQPIAVQGHGSDGSQYECVVHIPQAFTYLIMKLFAFRDQVATPEKDNARHHAMDLYRIVAMLTEPETLTINQRVIEFDQAPTTIEARRIVKEMFGYSEAIGFLRLREHRDFRRDMDADKFGAVVCQVFGFR